ncbi:MAG: rhodanese-like domain-containing protein [Rhodospirillales bacterium]|nr:rhodanese-like domain-containing protein [Rhodospirillales bacterium]
MVEDVAPNLVWEALKTNPQAVLVDVRTDAEWNFVGIPDLSEAGKQAVLIPWQLYPTMQKNARFLDALAEAGVTQADAVYFLCRSGARSMAAAQAAQAIGYAQVFNILDGFEGPPDPHGHRGQVAGWKASGLPWAQK